jgi:hypothetical protein
MQLVGKAQPSVASSLKFGELGQLWMTHFFSGDLTSGKAFKLVPSTKYCLNYLVLWLLNVIVSTS